MAFFKPKRTVRSRWILTICPAHCHYYGRQWALGQKAGAAPHRRPRCRRGELPTIATYCKDIGLDYLTVYAFSTENWKRPQEEVGAIMGLLKKYLLEAIGRMERDRVKMEFFRRSVAPHPGTAGAV